MADDSGIGLIFAALLDIVVGKAAKKHRWLRVIQGLFGLLALGLMAFVIYLTVKYS
ncbi:MAG: hypothetical protein KIT42_02165 [Rhodocyclaceae bacterium]|jgi:hypothetical protein|nr:hypothetical protein [Rhodocyclaceae bacterium]MCB1892257.1 hypothetical protein [Rhodocyclaceae bacterium]MCP5297553.1 hypothetical protein [Zoogloeaceae bacterium]MCW5594656.1 hypothetical protein [Rhodocyclaceae bacterium]